MHIQPDPHPNASPWTIASGLTKGALLVASWSAVLSGETHACHVPLFPNIFWESPVPGLLAAVLMFELYAFVRHRPTRTHPRRCGAGWIYRAAWVGFLVGYGCRFAHLVCGMLGVMGVCEGWLALLTLPSLHIGLLVLVTIMDAEDCLDAVNSLFRRARLAALKILARVMKRRRTRAVRPVR